MRDSEKKAFKDYNKVYTRSSEFPKEAVEDEIPKELLTAIDQGNESFFAEFKDNLPHFYRVLVENCTPIRLLETTFEEKNRSPYYNWGLSCRGRLIEVTIPLPGSEAITEIRKKTKFPSIPKEFHCFYVKMEGIGITDEEGLGMYDLPMDMDSWDPLDNYCENLANPIPLKKIDKIMDDFNGDDMRIIIKGSQGALILVNLAQKKPDLYHVQDHDFDNYKLLTNPVEQLDKYFASAVMGKPDNSVFI